MDFDLKASKQPYQSAQHYKILCRSTTTHLVAKNGTKKIIPLLWIKSSKKPQIKKFHKTDPPKNGNSDSKYDFEILKTKNQTQKRPPKVPNNQKHI